MTHASVNNQEVLAALVDRSLALLAELQRLEDQIRKQFAEMTLSGLDYTRQPAERPRWIPGANPPSPAKRLG